MANFSTQASPWPHRLHRVLSISALSILVTGTVVSDTRQVPAVAKAETQTAQLAFTEGAQRSKQTSATTTTRFPLGNPSRPFVNLENSDTTVIVTETGVVLPVLAESANSRSVRTPCRAIISTSQGTPVGRAHVVLDPGHGGKEPGAVSQNELLEKDLNLDVALAAQALLEDAGATVVLTRRSDHTLSLRARAAIARATQPGLFVSIHHNGGAPGLGDEPGTIVFTEQDSPEARRFGGVFYETLQPVLAAAASTKQAEYSNYIEQLERHDAQVRAYDDSLYQRDQVLFRNGQIPAPPTTVPPAVSTTPLTRDGYRVGQVREPVSTTTLPPTADIVAAVPEALPVPEPFTLEPVAEFKWAGSGAAGVRAWSRPGSGKDFLGVIRLSGNVPSVLVEYLYLSNPVEAELLADEAFVASEAQVLADSVIAYFSDPTRPGTGFVADEHNDRDIGGGGAGECVEPELGLASQR